MDFVALHKELGEVRPKSRQSRLRHNQGRGHLPQPSSRGELHQTDSGLGFDTTGGTTAAGSSTAGLRRGQTKNVWNVVDDAQERLHQRYEVSSDPQDEIGRGAYGVVRRAYVRLAAEMGGGGWGNENQALPGHLKAGGPSTIGSSSAGVFGGLSTSPAHRRGQQEQHQRVVAIKEIDKNKLSSRSLSNLMCEVETLSILAHPNIVKLVECFQDDNTLYIVMDYAAGGSLGKLAKKVKKLPEAVVQKLGYSLIKAVEYIHSVGIVHRDIKPANCLLSGPIVDFDRVPSKNGNSVSGGGLASPTGAASPSTHRESSKENNQQHQTKASHHQHQPQHQLNSLIVSGQERGRESTENNTSMAGYRDHSPGRVVGAATQLLNNINNNMNFSFPAEPSLAQQENTSMQHHQPASSANGSIVGPNGQQLSFALTNSDIVSPHQLEVDCTSPKMGPTHGSPSPRGGAGEDLERKEWEDHFRNMEEEEEKDAQSASPSASPSSKQERTSDRLTHEDLGALRGQMEELADHVHLIMADFGLAKMVGRDASLSGYCGTTAYMAPEVVARDKTYGIAVDMWSVGVMLFVLLSGEYPFTGSNTERLQRAILTGRMNSMNRKAWEGVSLGAKDFISKLLQPDPALRLTAGKALEHVWMASVGSGVQYVAYNREGNLIPSVAVEKKCRTPKVRLRGAILATMAMHRLLFCARCRELTREGSDALVLRNFPYLVSGHFDPQNPTVTAGAGCYGNWRAINRLTNMVEVSHCVQTYDVSSNGIDNVDVVQNIVRVSLSHPTLTSLNMNDNPIPPLAGRALIRLARQAVRLTQIHLERTALGGETVLQIEQKLKENERKRRESAPPVLHRGNTLSPGARPLQRGPGMVPTLSTAASGSYSFSPSRFPLTRSTSNPMGGGGGTGSALSSPHSNSPSRHALPTNSLPLSSSSPMGSPSHLRDRNGGGGVPPRGSENRRNRSEHQHQLSPSGSMTGSNLGGPTSQNNSMSPSQSTTNRQTIGTLSRHNREVLLPASLTLSYQHAGPPSLSGGKAMAQNRISVGGNANSSSYARDSNSSEHHHRHGHGDESNVMSPSGRRTVTPSMMSPSSSTQKSTNAKGDTGHLPPLKGKQQD